MLPVLAVCCPPLAVLATGQTRAAAVNAGLTLFFFVPGVLHARRLVEEYTVCRRYAAVMRAMEATA
jgi:uncharacterized membrane protein YqaE (UPF0057 family)